MLCVRITLLFIVSVVSLPFASLSRAAIVTGAEIIEYGIFDTVPIGSRREPGVLSGQVHEIPIAKLKERTAIIPALLGTNFGITIKLIGRPSGQQVNCWIRWSHPKVTNPETKESSERSEFPGRHPIGEAASTGFTFDHPWELVPGEWTVQIFWDWKLVAEKTFVVVLPH